MRFASRDDPPFSGKKISGSNSRHLALSCHGMKWCMSPAPRRWNYIRVILEQTHHVCPDPMMNFLFRGLKGLWITFARRRASARRCSRYALVCGSALNGHTFDVADRRFELVWFLADPPLRSCHARDGLFHQRATEIVRAAAQDHLAGVEPQLHPRHLHVVDAPVEQDRMPSRWAVVTISSHVSAGSLPLVRTHRTSSSRISAAVPGIVPRPRRRHSSRNSRNEMPSRVAPFSTSIGLKAWMWMSGTRA